MPGCRQVHATLMHLEQTSVKVPLERTNVGTHRRLRQVQQTPGAREAALCGDRMEGAQVVQARRRLLAATVLGIRHVRQPDYTWLDQTNSAWHHVVLWMVRLASSGVQDIARRSAGVIDTEHSAIAARRVRGYGRHSGPSTLASRATAAGSPCQVRVVSVARGRHGVRGRLSGATRREHRRADPAHTGDHILRARSGRRVGGNCVSAGAGCAGCAIWPAIGPGRPQDAVHGRLPGLHRRVCAVRLRAGIAVADRLPLRAGGRRGNAAGQ